MGEYNKRIALRRSRGTAVDATGKTGGNTGNSTGNSSCFLRAGFPGAGERGGFSLVEVTMALAITATSLVAVLGLLPLGLNLTQTATEQTAAANIARAIIADLRSTSPGCGSSPLFQCTIPGVGGLDSIAGDAPQVLTFSSDGAWIGSSNGNAPSLGNRGNSGNGGSAGTADPAAAPTLQARYRAAIGFRPAAPGHLDSRGVRVVISWPGMADGIQPMWPRAFAGSYEVVSALNGN